jgi:hypothetical protein
MLRIIPQVEQERWESKQESSDDDNAETESEDNG